MSLTLLGPLRASAQQVPLFSDRVAAGFPSPAEDHIEATLSLDELCIKHPSATFLLRAGGDSMQGAIMDGDVLVVDRSVSPSTGMVVVATVSGGFTCKRLEFEGDRPVLRAANPAYPDIRIADGEELEVFGVVVAVVRTLI
ncbi:LexA family protein [Geopseudomonas aromaticivorans]